MNSLPKTFCAVDDLRSVDEFGEEVPLAEVAISVNRIFIYHSSEFSRTETGPILSFDEAAALHTWLGRALGIESTAGEKHV